MAGFDPYLKWLGIRSQGRAPNHYRLLGLDLFESDTDIIANAADRQISHVQSFQQGPEGAYAQDVLNRLATAKLTLLKPEAKAVYDQKLKEKIKALRAARAKAAGGSSGSGIDINASVSGTNLPSARLSGTQLPQPVPVAAPKAVQPVRQQVGSVSPGGVRGGNIARQPEKKKRSPLVSLILALLMWASSAGAAVGVGWFIVTSSWFPGNQPDPEVAQLYEDPFSISVAGGGEAKPLPGIDEVLRPAVPIKKQKVQIKQPAALVKKPSAPIKNSDDESVSGDGGSHGQDFASSDNTNAISNVGKKPKRSVGGIGEGKRNGDSTNDSFREMFGDDDATNTINPAPTPPPVKVEPIVRSAQPERAAVTLLAQELKELYKSGYDKDATPDLKKKLAESLLNDGLTTEDPTMQFAMIDQSIDVASSIADATTAVEALEAMDLRFEIDFWKRADDIVDTAKRKIKSPMQYASTAAGIDKLLDRSLSESRFNEAYAVASVGSMLSRKFKDLKRSHRFDSMAKGLKDVRAIAKKAKAADDKLAANPEDPAANLDRGNYLYLVHDDLRAAMEHWGKSSSEQHQAIASLETEANRTDGTQLLELGLAWKKLGQKLKTSADIKYSFRAKELCEKSAPMLDGLKKLKAENTALELKTALRGMQPINLATLSSADMPSTGSPFLDAVYKQDWSIDFSTSTIPDLQKVTFLPSGMAAMVTTKGANYRVMFQVQGDEVYWTQPSTSGKPVKVSVRPYITGFEKLKCFYQTSAAGSEYSAGYATPVP